MARNPYGADIYNQGNQFPTEAGGRDPRMSDGPNVGMNDLAALVDIPQLDPRGAAAMGQGLSILGKGISRVGENTMNLLEMQAKAITTKRITENERVLADLSAQIKEAHIREPDETKWHDLDKEIIAKMPALPDDLSPDARDHIEARRAVWQGDQYNSTLVSSAVKSVRDADSDLKAGTDIAIRHKDLSRANELTDQRVAHGTLTPQEAENEKELNGVAVEQVEKREKADSLNAYRNNIIELSKGRPPDEVRKYIENDYGGMNLTPVEKEHLLDVANGVFRDETSKAVEDFSSKLASGEVWNDYEIEATYGANPNVSPQLLKKMKADAAAKKNYENKNGPAGDYNFVKAYRDAQAWKPERNTDAAAEEYLSKMSNVDATVPDDRAGVIKSMLRQKFGASKTDADPRPEVQKLTTRTVNTTFKRQLAPWKAEAQKLAKAAAVLPKDSSGYKKWQDAQDIYFKKEKENMLAQAEVEKQMNSWYQANPDKMNDPQAVSKQLNKLLPDSTIIGNMDILNYGPDASLDEMDDDDNAVDTVPDDRQKYQPGGDALNPPLPDASSPPDNMLIPNSYNETRR